MKKFLSILFLLIQASVLSAESKVYVGPHFNYTRLHFDNPSNLEGYMGGVTVGGEYQCSCLFTALDFEGYWNAGPITGRPCQRSSLTEYYLEWKLGTSFWQCCNCVLVKPYVGFGYNRFLNEQDPQNHGLCYTYNKLFVPLGFYAYAYLNPTLRGGIQFEWRPDVYSCVNIIHIGLNTKLEHAFRVQLPIEWTFDYCCRCFDLSIVPFFDWNEFGEVCDSSPNWVKVDIPHLTRWNVGLRVLLGYHF